MSQRKGIWIIIAVLLLLLLSILGFAGYSVWNNAQEEDTSASVEPEADESNKSDATDETDTAPDLDGTTFESELYPALSFVYPAGWTVNEPEEYDESAFGPGTANGIITVTKGETMLNLRLVTVLATGFEGYTCTVEEDLTAVNGYYRFTYDEDVIYQDGITESDEEDWELAMSQPDFLNIEEPNPNYCVSFPYLATYDATLLQADYPDVPYGFDDQVTALVWLSADVVGDTSAAILAETDQILQSLSPSIVSFE